MAFICVFRAKGVVPLKAHNKRIKFFIMSPVPTALGDKQEIKKNNLTLRNKKAING